MKSYISFISGGATALGFYSFALIFSIGTGRTPYTGLTKLFSTFDDPPIFLLDCVDMCLLLFIRAEPHESAIMVIL